VGSTGALRRQLTWLTRSWRLLPTSVPESAV